MTYTPTLFTKDGEERIAYTISDYVRLKFDGWIPGGEAPPLPTYQPSVKTVNGHSGPYVSLAIADIPGLAAAIADSGLSEAEVQAIVDDVIAGAPGALDTLNELAAALGDDANFAASVTTLISQAQTNAIAAANRVASLRAFGFARDERAFKVTDIPVVTAMAPPVDGAFNRTYTFGGADWPLTRIAGAEFASGGISFAATPSTYGLRTHRFITDADAVAFYSYGTLGEGWSMKIDGHPTAIAPDLITTATGMFFNRFDFGSAGVRTIELTCSSGMYQLYVKKPYRAWKAPASQDAKILVVGDSFVAPTVYEGNATTYSAVDQFGIYQGLGPELGVSEVLCNGEGGTGYVTPFASWNYYDRLFHTGTSPYGLVADIQPDVVVIHGGGANDLSQGHTTAQIIAAATTLFTDLRTALPNAKLVFVEGLTPPVQLGGFRSSYIAIREALQTALASVGVYYVDTTTDPWLSGLGYRNHINADNENTNVYVGDDGVHLTVEGNEYIRDRIAPILRKILRDNGPLLNTLVS